MRARPSAPTTHCFLLPTLYSLLVPFVVHLHLRQRTAELPCGRAQARQPRTTFYPLLPTLFKKRYSWSIRGSIICPFVVLYWSPFAREANTLAGQKSRKFFRTSNKGLLFLLHGRTSSRIRLGFHSPGWNAETPRCSASSMLPAPFQVH